MVSLWLCVTPLAWSAEKAPAKALYMFEPGDDWVSPCNGENPNRSCFHSRKRNAQLTVSALPIEAKRGELDKVAQSTLKFILDREQKLHSQGGGDDREGMDSAGAQYARVNYVGTDKSRRWFRYSGIVSESKVVNVYVELPAVTAEGGDALLDSLLLKLKY